MSSLRERLMQGSKRGLGTVTTANATPTDLNPNGGVLALANNSAVLVTAEIITRRTDSGSEVGGYVVQAVVKRGANAAATALVGSATTTTVGEDTAGFDATIVADTTAGGAKVQVTGAASKTLKWNAQFRYVAVA